MYALVGGWRDAEELYRKEVVRPLVRKVRLGSLMVDGLHADVQLADTRVLDPSPSCQLISAGTLDTPIEPAQTLGASLSSTALFAAALPPATPVTPGAIVPATPMTPSTPFQPGVTPHATGGSSEHNPFEEHLIQRGPRLDDLTPFGGLYNRLLGAVSKPEVTMVLQVAALLPASAGGQVSVDVSDDEGEDGDGSGTAAGKRGFEFFANVVWKEIGERLMDELGSVLFAAGRPSELHQVSHLSWILTHRRALDADLMKPHPAALHAHARVLCTPRESCSGPALDPGHAPDGDVQDLPSPLGARRLLPAAVEGDCPPARGGPRSSGRGQ